MAEKDDDLTLEPDPPAEADRPSGTLAADETGIDIPEHYAWAIKTLGDLVDGIISGDMLAFNLTLHSRQHGLNKLTFVKDQAVDLNELSVATMGHGRGMIDYLATLQGNAPPNNRSELRH